MEKYQALREDNKILINMLAAIFAKRNGKHKQNSDRLEAAVTKERLIELRKTMNNKEIAKYFKCSSAYIGIKVREFGLQKKKMIRVGDKEYSQALKKAVTKDKLVKFLDKGKTSKDIAEYFGCSKDYINKKKKEFGLSRPYTVRDDRSGVHLR